MYDIDHKVYDLDPDRGTGRKWGARIRSRIKHRDTLLRWQGQARILAYVSSCEASS